MTSVQSVSAPTLPPFRAASAEDEIRNMLIYLKVEHKMPGIGDHIYDAVVTKAGKDSFFYNPIF